MSKESSEQSRSVERSEDDLFGELKHESETSDSEDQEKSYEELMHKSHVVGSDNSEDREELSKGSSEQSRSVERSEDASEDDLFGELKHESRVVETSDSEDQEKSFEELMHKSHVVGSDDSEDREELSKESNEEIRSVERSEDDFRSRASEASKFRSHSSSVAVNTSLEVILCPVTNKVIWKPVLTKDTGSYSRFLSEFEEDRVLGVGGFGCVVVAKNKLDNQSYAIKKVKLEKVLVIEDSDDSHESTGKACEKTDKEQSLSFEDANREVTVMSQLCHPGIVRYYGAWLEGETVGIMKAPKEEFEDKLPKDKLEENSESSKEKSGSSKDESLFGPGPLLCIQMELCHGSLEMLMGKDITDEKIMDIFKQLVEALDYLHSHSIRHGDLSPANIFIDKSKEKLKIADFGLASTTHGELEEGERRAMTVYSAPELKLERGAYSNLKCDIYSLGVILVELYARYGDEDVSARARELSGFTASGTLPESAKNINQEALTLIRNMTDRDPETRPSARQIMELQPWVNLANG